MSTVTTEQSTGIATFNDTPLLPVDICDACGAQQARVRVTTAKGELLFCGHDYHKHEASLVTVTLHVHDQRADLLPKPYDPATDNS